MCQLLELQREEVDVQASVTGTPNAFAPPGLLLPNGFNVGASTATGAGQDGCFNAAEAWITNRMEECRKNLSKINASAPKFGTQHFDVDYTPHLRSHRKMDDLQAKESSLACPQEPSRPG